jgi:hypothetical protein
MLRRMKLSKFTFAFILTASLLFVGLACSSDDKASQAEKKSSNESATLTLVPGEAGGVYEETFNASATVKAIDKSTRTITLKGKDGEGKFTAPPEVRNFDQIRVGDRVKATMLSRLVIFVSPNAAPSSTSAEMSARAPKGAKPWGLVAESFEVVGTIKSIDPNTRAVVIEFPGADTRTVKARPDVELSRYKAGDKLVIRVSQHLMVLVESPK